MRIELRKMRDGSASRFVKILTLAQPPPPVFVMFNTANACSSCSVHAAFACVGWGAIAVFDWRGAMNG